MKPTPGMDRPEESFLPEERTEERQQELRYCISARGVTRLLLSITFVLLFMHLLAFWIGYYDRSGSDLVRYLDVYFNFNRESNFPSFFASLLLLFSALLLWFIYQLTETTNRYRKQWLLLAAVFLFLSLDEAVKIHERIESLTRLVFTDNLGGYLTWTWVVPYTLLFGAVAVYCFGFVMQLPPTIRRKFMLAGLLFVFAAAGIESIEGRLMITTAEDPVVLMMTTTVQELGEMISIIFFTSGLLHYLALTSKNLHLTIQ